MADENEKPAFGGMSRETLANHLHLVPEYVEDDEWAYIGSLVEAARSYVKDQCAIDDGYIDAHPDLEVAVLIITADLYDERTRVVESVHDNRTLTFILSHHDHNLVAGDDDEDE